MRTSDVLAHFDGNQSAVARFLSITRASVNAWGELVPPLSAAKLHAKLHRINPKIRFDPMAYEDWNVRKVGRRRNGRAA